MKMFRASHATNCKLLAFLALVFACQTQAARAQDDNLTPFYDARVVAVLDGNTLDVRNVTTGQQSYVRLRAVDAPELRQPYGTQSREHLSSLVAGKNVRVEFKGTDRMGTVEGRVVLDGEDINLAQLDAGLAWFHIAYTNELSDEQKRLYQETERDARAAGRGLWQDAAPTAPWVYRTAHKLGEDPRDIPQTATPAQMSVVADRRSKLYYLPDCPGYARIPARSRVRFKSADDATRAGYKLAPACAP
jgi:endonuclease YncB( thermonuclease family)